MHKWLVFFLCLLVVTSACPAENNRIADAAQPEKNEVTLKKAVMISFLKTIRDNPFLLWALIADNCYGVSKITYQNGRDVRGTNGELGPDQSQFSGLRILSKFCGIVLPLKYGKTLVEECLCPEKKNAPEDSASVNTTDNKKEEKTINSAAKVAISIPIAMMLAMAKHPFLTAHVAVDWWYGISRNSFIMDANAPLGIDDAKFRLLLKSIAAGSAAVLTSECADALLYIHKD